MTLPLLAASVLALSSVAPPQAGIGPELAPLDAAPAVPVPASSGPVQHLVKVSSDPMGLLRLQRLDLDLVSVDLAGGEATLLVTDEQMEQIRGVRLTPEVLIEEVDEPN